MEKYSELKREINDLANEGSRLVKALNTNAKQEPDIVYFLDSYQAWYSKALRIIKRILPERLDDFILLYRNDKRKKISETTYTISDALNGIEDASWAEKSYSPTSAAILIFHQKQILLSCIDVLESKVANIQSILQADVFDSELESANHLKKMGFLRSAGAICGVILEKHLSSVCCNRNIAITKKNKCLSDYNDELKDVAYDTNQWRKIQYFADIRNLCDHNKGREPNAEEIDDLIIGTDKIIKTIF